MHLRAGWSQISSAAQKVTFRSVEALYQHFERRRTPEFLQPIVLPDGKHDYKYLSFVAFADYLILARSLGVLSSEDPISLTASGKQMSRNDGARYNVVLLQLLTKTWADHGIKLEDIEDSIGQRLRGNAVPDSDAIYADLILAKRLTLSKHRFKVLLDLTAYVGALEASADKAFFLASSQDADM